MSDRHTQRLSQCEQEAALRAMQPQARKRQEPPGIQEQPE